MEEKEFETLLLHLGRHIDYMVLRMQQDVQKSFKKFEETRNSKKFCSKLADILKQFSETTVQFSQDLEIRIKNYNKEDEYQAIISKLIEISSKDVTTNCNTCKSRDKRGAETSNSLGPPNNNNDNSTEESHYDLKNEVLSQYSLHIDGEDEIKSEDLTQASVTQSNNFSRLPTKDEPSTPNDLNTSFPTIISNNGNTDDVAQQENKNQLEKDNEMYENNDVTIGNSNSEKIDVDGGLDDVILTHFEKSIPDSTIPDGSLNVPEEKSDEISDIPPPKVIPLPYEPLFKNDQKQTTVTSDKEPIVSFPLLEQDVTISSNNDKQRDLTTVNETAVQGNISQLKDQTSDEDNVVNSVQNTNANRSNFVNLPSKSSHTDDTDDDSDVEIISVTLSREDEIMKTQPDTSNKVDVANSLQESYDSDVEFIDESVHISKEVTVMVVKSSKASGRQNSKEDVNNYENTGENDFIETGDCSATLSGENCSHESAKKSSAVSLNSEDQNTETTQPYSDQIAVAGPEEKGNDAIELSDTDENYTDTEVVLNISSRKSSDLPLHMKSEDTVSDLPEGHNCVKELPNLEEKDVFNIDSTQQDEHSSQTQDESSIVGDSGAEIVSHGSPRRGGNVATSQNQNADQDKTERPNEEPPLINSDEITVAESLRSASSENYSDTTVVTALAETQGDSNDDSDSTIVTSPVAQAGLNCEENVQNVRIPENSESSTQTLSQDEKQQNSDSNDSLYSKATQKLNVDSNGSRDSDVDFDAPTQRFGSTNAESSDTDNTKDNNDIVEGQAQNFKTSDNNDDLVGLTGSEVAVAAEKSVIDADDQEEAATQDIETTRMKAVPETEEVITENCENDELSQESFIFDLEKGDRSMEDLQGTIPENMQNDNESTPKNKENGENYIDSEESHPFDLERDPGSTEDSVPQVAETDGPALTMEVSVEPPKDKNENTFKDAKGTDADDLLTSAPESGGSSDNGDLGGTIETKPKQKLKDKDRQFLLKVIAEYFIKKRKEKVTRDDKSKVVSEKSNNSNKKRRKKSVSKGNKKISKRDEKANVTVKEKKVKGVSSHKIGKKAKHFLSVSHINENSHSSDEFAKNNDRTIQEDSSDNLREHEEITDCSSAELKEEENNEPKSKMPLKSDIEDSNDSEEIFSMSKKNIGTQKTCDFEKCAQGKSNNNNPDNNKDSQNSDHGSQVDADLTQKVDDIRKLKHQHAQNTSAKTIFNEPAEETSQENEEQDVNSENDDCQVFNPSLSTTKSDGDQPNSPKTERDSQIVSPYKRKSVKRLRSSDESDSESAKKMPASQESTNDLYDKATQEGVRSKSLKRLLSTEDELEDTQEYLEGDEGKIDNLSKKRKVQRLPSTEHSSPDDVDFDARSELNQETSDLEADEATSEESNLHIEPTQFHLDDKARDDLLELLDQHASRNTSENCSSNSENNESDRDEKSELDGDENSKKEGDSDRIEASQFNLGDSDRDNLLNLLTDKENEERSVDEEVNKNDQSIAVTDDDSESTGESNRDMENSGSKRSDDSKGTKSCEATTHKEDDLNQNDTESDENDEIEQSQFKLSSKERDEFLEMLSNQDEKQDRKSKEKEKDKQVPKKNLKKKDELARSVRDKRKDTQANKRDGLDHVSDEEDIELSQFKLDDKARDDFLEMLSAEQTGDSKIDGSKRESNTENENSQRKVDDSRKKLTGDGDMEIKSNQFKLSDKERDEFLDMLSNNLRDNNINEGEVSTTRNKEANLVKDGDDNLKENNANNEVDKNKEEIIDDVLDDTVTENSQGIDGESSKLDDGLADESDDTVVDDDDIEKIDEKQDDYKAITIERPSEFRLDEKERNELLNMLSKHIENKESSSGSDSSESEYGMEENGERERREKRKKKPRSIDRSLLLELLQEYENTVAGKDACVENINNDMEYEKMGMGDDENLQDIAKSDISEDSSDSDLLELIREETVEQEFPKKSPRKSRNTSKEAWHAYQQLIKDGGDDISDETGSEISDIDIEDLDLDFSDQERKQKEQKLYVELREQFSIDKELIINVEQADISEFDLRLLSRINGKAVSKIDRLCDLSNVLQKRKISDKKRQKIKRRRFSASDYSDSDSDNDSLLSTSSNWSNNSRGANGDRASNINSSPLHNLTDNDLEQEKLANALWENIKNSSDESDGGWSNDESTELSDSEEERSKKKKDTNGDGGNKKGQEKKKQGNRSSGDEDDGSEKDSNDESCTESEDKGKKESDDKKADLDSSDEEDFVGVRKGRSAWRFDPLLTGCVTSDETESDSDSENERRKRSLRIRKKLKTVKSDSDSESSENSNEGRKKMKTTTKKPNWSSDSSDVEFIESFERKKTTPKKTIVIDEQAEEDSPSKIGKGRRNIRALVEDDELAEATKQAKKEETERIKRLQEREKVKESFTQSQSFGSQLSEDETDPLILDVNEEIQIKVHPKITKKLKPHQRSGIQFMWDSCYESVKQLKKGYEGSGCILAHCMGLGKTLQALALIHTVFNHKDITQTKHVLVVCPLSTVSNWRNEYKLAFKDIKHLNKQLYTIEDKKAAGMRFSIVNKWWKSGGILVMGYECFGIMTNKQKLDKWSAQNLCHINEVLTALVNPGPDLVICDEGHLLRNKQTQRNLALNKVATKRRIVLTGTPLQNNLLEYYYMVHFVKPNLLGTEKEYKTNFVNPISNGQFEDSTAVDILFMKKRTHVLHKILAKTVQRVEDTELRQYLPELIDQALFVKLSDLQVKFYNTYLDTANARPVSYTAKGDINRKNFLADIQILRYICTHPDLVTIAKRSGRPKIREQDVIEDNIDDAIEDKVFAKADWFKDLIPDDGVKKLELGTKMMIALGIVEEATTNNDKVLIFSQMHAEMDCLEFFLKEKLNCKKGVDYQRMDGTISPEVRTRMCDQFNNENNTRLRVFIMSTKVGGLGLNLTAANRVILMNVNWNPSYDTQSVFRAFRFGQNKSVYVYRLIAIDTMEEKMYQRQITKLAVAHRVVDKYQITRHYSAGDIQEFYSARPTAEGERPVPNVPEDRILAKLIQKHPFLYRWHEHRALLANRPEEDLNEQQKNAAWEEFNKRNEHPPLGIPLPQPLVNLAGPSGLQNRSAIPGYHPQYPNIPTSGNIAAADHNYSLPKTNPVFQQRTSSIDDFRTTTQSKYIPRPLFVDVKAPLGPRPNLSGLNPVPIIQKLQNNVSKAMKSHSDQMTNTTLTTTMQTKPGLGKGITITAHTNTTKKEPPLAHSQKPSISILPLAHSQNSSANIVTSTRPVSNITTTKPPPSIPKNANMVQNPLNLSKITLQSAMNVSQPNGSSRVQTLKEKTQKQGKNVIQNNGIKPTQIAKSLPLRNNDIIPPTEKTAKRIVIPTRFSTSATTVTTVPPIVQLPNKVVGPRPSTSTPINNEVISPNPLINGASLSTSTTAISTSDPLVVSSTSATSSLQQSPLQKQMRSFMEHLHQLQSQMKERETSGIPNSVGSSLESVTSTNVSRAVNTNTSTTNSQAAGPSNLPISLPARTIVRVGPKPVIGGISTTNVTGLNAARNLSNITKTYQKVPDKTKGLSSSSNRPTARDTNPPPVSVAGPSALTPISRVILPVNIPPNKVSSNGSSPKVVRVRTVGEVMLNPVNIVNKNGSRVVTNRNVARLNGAARASNASMLIGGNATRIVPVSPGSKKIVISQKGNSASTAVRMMAARPTDNPLRRKMAAKLTKITGTSPKLPSPPQRSFNNGTNVKTYQAKKNNSLSKANSLPSISLVQSLVSKANKENRSKKKITWKHYNNVRTSSIDLSNDDIGNSSSGSLPKDMVNTLKKKGVSINYLGKGNGKDVINLD